MPTVCTAMQKAFHTWSLQICVWHAFLKSRSLVIFNFHVGQNVAKALSSSIFEKKDPDVIYKFDSIMCGLHVLNLRFASEIECILDIGNVIYGSTKHYFFCSHVI